MGLQHVFFIVFGVVALGAAVAAVSLRSAFHSSLALAGSCLGVAGVLVSLGAPIVAGVQALVFVGGIAALLRFGPASLREMTQQHNLDHNRWWWAGVAVAVALCAALGWAAFAGDWGPQPEPDLIPAGSVPALGTALIDPAGFVLPLASAVVLLSVAQAGPLLVHYAVIADEAANRPDSSAGAAVLLALAGKRVYLSVISMT